MKLFETFCSESRIYLVLEYADKGDLLEYINSRRPYSPGIGEEKAKRFFKQLVEGLDYCHKRNTVHRLVLYEFVLRLLSIVSLKTFVLLTIIHHTVITRCVASCRENFTV